MLDRQSDWSHLGAGLSPDLGEEPGVVDEDAMHALLQGVEEADILTVHLEDDGSVPCLGVLIVTAIGIEG